MKADLSHKLSILLLLRPLAVFFRSFSSSHPSSFEMNDADKCYGYLNDNVPLWTSEVEAVARKIEKKCVENAASLDLPAAEQDGNEDKNGENSMETLRPAEDNSKDTDILLDGSTPVSGSPGEAKRPSPSDVPAVLFLPANCKRKRNSSTLTSGHVTRMGRYRTKTSMTVTYDSEIQQSFDGLVRSIGAGRNKIRMAIRAARMAAAAASATANAAKAENNNDGDEDEGFKNASMVLARIGYRARFGVTEAPRAQVTGTNGAMRSYAADRVEVSDSADGSENFRLLDRTLEKAQNQCERAAHQVLRDGECTEEIDSVLAWFREVLSVCEKELGKLSTVSEEAIAPATDNVSKSQPKEEENIVAAPKSDVVDVGAISNIQNSGIKYGVGMKVDEKISASSADKYIDMKLDTDDLSKKLDVHIKSKATVI